MAEYNRKKLAATVSKLRNRIKRFRDSGASIGEENTKITLVEPVLAALGWDLEEPDEVHREYRKKPQDAPVDYALSISRTPRLFIEAKALKKSLDDRRWASQVLGYATVVGVEWCVLTNGDEYRLYNAHAAVDVEEKLFRRVAISDTANQPLLEDTLDLLSRPRLQDKRLTALWEAHHVDRRVEDVVESLWSKPEPAFVRLIRRHAKELTPKQVQASLQRCRIRIDFPVEVELDEKKPERSKTKRKKKTGKDALVEGLPSQAEIQVPLLREIAHLAGSMQLKTQFDGVAKSLADEFSLSRHQRNTATQDEKTTVWKNRLQWVRLSLVKKGDLDGSVRGVWRITEQGRARLVSRPRRGLKLAD